MWCGSCDIWIIMWCKSPSVWLMIWWERINYSIVLVMRMIGFSAQKSEGSVKCLKWKFILYLQWNSQTFKHKFYIQDYFNQFRPYMVTCAQFKCKTSAMLIVIDLSAAEVWWFKFWMSFFSVFTVYTIIECTCHSTQWKFDVTSYHLLFL